ncbi:MAG: KTSC domain-containing protein [Hyphomicrobiaceae bacterium]|jgi:hypothetical protein
MLRRRVSSSVIAAIDYDDERRLLDVEFRSGTVYRYFKVPVHVFEGLCAAPSIGEYFNALIKDAYVWEQLR